MRPLSRFALLFATCGFLACEYDEIGPNISGVYAVGIRDVRVVPETDTAFIPDTGKVLPVQFEALAFARTGAVIAGMRFVWTSSNPFVARVDTAGLVTPLALGETIISASAGKIGRARLVVLRKVVPLLPLP